MILQAVRKLILVILWTAFCLAFQFIVVRLRLSISKTFPLFYWRIYLRMIGIKVVVHGQWSRAQPTLFVSNHSSYLDIMILGSLIPGSFISKNLAHWPIISWLTKLNRTVFIDRQAHQQVQHQRDILYHRLLNRQNLILFPEGTTSDGNRVLPFKSSLFDCASTCIDGSFIVVQPISITATKLDDFPIGRTFRPFYSWYGNMDLVTHMWVVFTCHRMTVEVVFHSPVTMGQFKNRKEMSKYCEHVITAEVVRALSGYSFASSAR